MKLNVANPATGCQKLFEIEEEKKLRPFFEKRIASDVPADSLGDEWKGYIFRIAGGNDKQGFPMKQGVLTTGRVRLLLKKGMSCFRERRQGERKRKSVHGCIVDNSLSVLSLIVVKKGEQEIPGLTDVTIPRRLGPKRASKIRKLFNLSKEDDVSQYVVRRPAPKKPGRKPRNKAPKIQRLVTPETVARKNRMKALRAKRITKAREDAAEYAKLLAQRIRQAKDRRRRSSGGSISKRESRSEAVEDKTGTGKGHMRELAKAFYNIGRQSVSGKRKADKKKGKKSGKGLKGVKGGKVTKAKAGKAKKKPQKPKVAKTEKKEATSKPDAPKAAPKSASKADAPKKAPVPKKPDPAAAAPKSKAGKATGKKPAGKPASGAPAASKPASGKPSSGKPASGKSTQKKEPAKK